MAEVFGAVASGLALAEFAVQLRSLLTQISDAPGTWESLVGQVESYVGILNALDWNDVLDTEISPSLRSSLHVAALQCQNAVKQLSLIVKDLSALGNPSSRRRTIAAIKFVLQKDSILRFEHQLQTAVQCLTLVHQLYMFAWQKTQQPDVLADVIVSRLLKQMSLAPKATMAIGGSMTAPVMNAWPEPFFATDDFPRRLDFPSLSSPCVFEAFAQYSTNGWKAVFEVHNVFIEDSSHYDDAYDLLRTNDREQIEQALERRQFTIHDRFWVDGHAHSFAEFACATSSWESVNYFLEETPQSLNRVTTNYIDEDQDDEAKKPHLETFLKRRNVRDEFKISEFVRFDVDGASFDQFREQIWPDDYFYSDSFRTQRHEIALNLAYFSDSFPSTYRFFRHVLSPKGFLKRQDIYTGRFSTKTVKGTDLLLHGLVSAISAIPWRVLKNENHEESSAHLKGTSQNPGKYMETAMLDGWALIASEVVPLWDNLHESVPGQDGFKTKTAFFFSFKQCFRKLFASPTGITTRDRSRSMRFRLIEPSLRLWLNILCKAGIDLKGYGEKEAELFGQATTTQRSFLMKDVTYPCNRRISQIADEDDTWGEELEVDLIGFQHGEKVDDWKLWWSEPTDVFAGDFWRLVLSEL